MSDMPELRYINVPIREDKKDQIEWALSDILCWMDGFKAAGGIYHPDSIEILRDLNTTIKLTPGSNAITR